MDNNPALSVVMPAYLEGESLSELLPRIKKTLEAMGISWEVLIIDINPPRDITPDLCSKWGMKHILREGGDSYGSAIRTGIAKSTGEFVMFMDADGSHEPEFTPVLWHHTKDSDVVIASRYIKGGDTDNPKVLIWMSRILNMTYSVVLGIRCKDVSNSFKIYRGDKLRSLVLKCNNFDIVEEMLVKMTLVTNNIRVKEVPFVFKKRLFGKTKRNLLLFMFSFFFTLAKLLLLKISYRKTEHSVIPNR